MCVRVCVCVTIIVPTLQGIKTGKQFIEADVLVAVLVIVLFEWS